MMNPNNQNLNQEKMNDLDQPTMTGASVAGSSAVSAAYDADEDEPVPAHKANIPKGKGRAEYAGLPSDPDSDDPYDSNDGFAFPLNVTDHQKIEWRQFHERIAVHAVLKNRLIDLKILIDTEFAKKIYNHAWNSMAPNFRKLWLMEIKILAEERKTAFLELAGKSIDTSDTSAQILVNAKEIALRRLRSMYIEVNDQRQPNPRFVSIMNEYFDSMIESVEMDKSFVNSIDKGSYEAEIKRLFAIIDKVDIHLSRVEERNVPSYFDVWYEKDINKHERYYTLLMLHVSEAKAPYLYPEPFGSFLRSLRDATSLEALKNFMMTSASSQDSAQDLLPDPDLGVALEAERLREQLIPNGVILKEEEDNDRIKVCESLMRKTEDAAEADAYRIEIAEIQMRKSARLEKLRISIFKRSICRFHMVAVSPNYVLSDALVEDANKTMEANLLKIAPMELLRDSGLLENRMLVNRCTLLEVVVRRGYHDIAEWLLCCGADANILNARRESSLHILREGDITALHILAKSISFLVHHIDINVGTHFERALQYRTIVNYHYNNSRKRPDPRHNLIIDSKRALAELHQHMEPDVKDMLQLSLGETELYVRGWIHCYRLWRPDTPTLFWASFDEIVKKMGATRQLFYVLNQQLLSTSAIGHDAALVEAMQDAERWCNATSGYGQLSEKFSQISRRYTEQEVGYGFRREDLKSIGTIEETRQMIARAATVHTNHVHQMPQIQSDWARALKESQERERLKDATIQRLERAMESNTTRTERIEATLVAILQQMQPRPEQGQASSGAGVHFTAPHAGQTEGSQQQLPANGL